MFCGKEHLYIITYICIGIKCTVLIAINWCIKCNWQTHFYCFMSLNICINNTAYYRIFLLNFPLLFLCLRVAICIVVDFLILPNSLNLGLTSCRVGSPCCTELQGHVLCSFCWESASYYILYMKSKSLIKKKGPVTYWFGFHADST